MVLSSRTWMSCWRQEARLDRRRDRDEQHEHGDDAELADRKTRSTSCGEPPPRERAACVDGRPVTVAVIEACSGTGRWRRP